MVKQVDEVNRYICHLYDAGYRGTSDQNKGMSTLDEEHLTGLLINATPQFLLPSLDELDPKNEAMYLLAKYMCDQDIDTASQLLQHLVDGAVALYAPKIQHLMEQKAEDDPKEQIRREEWQREQEHEARRTRG